MLFVDLDSFKDVNDSAGHALGDQVLQSVAKRLLACVRGSDTVSRQGGDEFVILLSEIDDSRSLMPVAKNILAAIAAPHDLTPHVFHITASIGVSIFPQDGPDGRLSSRAQTQQCIGSSKMDGTTFTSSTDD